MPGFQQTQYKRRKAQGVCVRCGGKHGPRVTTLLCERCRIETNKQRAVSKASIGSTSVERWKAANLCQDCGGKHGPRVTMTRCEYCNTQSASGRDKVRDRRRITECILKWKAAGLCHSCGGKHGPKTDKKFCTTCRENSRLRLELYRQRLKDEAFAAYGGYKCYCCGETERKFLTLDHVNGGGTQQRKAGMLSPYNWLRKHNFPPGFARVACYNCNCAAGRRDNYDGICPHQKHRDMQPEYII